MIKDRVTDKINQIKATASTREDRIEALKALGIAEKAAVKIGYLITIITFADNDDGIKMSIDMDGEYISLYGKTYPVKDRIKDAGFVWNRAEEAWTLQNV